ncbi:MAG: hypothetical protein OIF32_00875 [Campylobacterales bacterium]|nr:hypothetical protein [Campylobacterales bacterium]
MFQKLNLFSTILLTLPVVFYGKGLKYENTIEKKASRYYYNITVHNKSKTSIKIEELKKTLYPNNKVKKGVNTPILTVCKQDTCLVSELKKFRLNNVKTILLDGSKTDYIVLEVCESKEKACRQPHRKLGSEKTTSLIKRGFKIHYWRNPDEKLIVVGPFNPEKVEGHLRGLRKDFPKSYIY